MISSCPTGEAVVPRERKHTIGRTGPAAIPPERIERRILLLRGQKVMLGPRVQLRPGGADGGAHTVRPPLQGGRGPAVRTPGAAPLARPAGPRGAKAWR